MGVCIYTARMKTTTQAEGDMLLLIGVDSSDSESELESESDSEHDERPDTPDRHDAIPAPVVGGHDAIPAPVVGEFVRGSVLDFISTHADEAVSRSIAFDRAVALQLRQPSPDATCPISMDSIAMSTVRGFEGFLLDERRPTFTEAVLACGHSFSACCLVVAWLTAPMRCPLCRAGIDSTLEISSLPIKWKTTAEEYFDRLSRVETEEQVSQHIQVDAVLHSVFALQIHLCVYLALEDGTVQAMVVDFVNTNPSAPPDPTGLLSLRIPRAQIRALSRMAVRCNATHANLVVFARRIGDDDAIHLGEITQSGYMQIPMHHPSRPSLIAVQEQQMQRGVPVRDVVIVQRADIRRHPEPEVNERPRGTDNQATFSMSWQVHPNRSLNTLLDITFSVKLSSLAMFIGDMISEI
jgi:hypothetical protein